MLTAKMPETGTAFLYRTQTASPMHTTTPHFCSFPSSKPTDFLPSLLGKHGEPILTPQLPRVREITLIKPHACGKT